MSIPDTNGSNGRSVKTLAIRLEPDLHAQLSLIAQLRTSTITDEIRTAIEAHIAAVKTAPELAGKADSVLAEIERDAAARREAIATLFGTEGAATTDHPSVDHGSSDNESAGTGTPPAGHSRGRKTASGTAN